MELNTYTSLHEDTATALIELSAQLSPDSADAQMVFVFYGCGHDDQLIHHFLCSRFPDAAMIGGTSAGGLMTERGVLGEQGIGLLVMNDATGDYGAAAMQLGSNPEDMAAQALSQALANCDCAGQLPMLIWVYQAPGQEEAVITGLRRIVGDQCPIVGGSSADNTVQGHWRQLGPKGPMTDGVVVAVLFPSKSVGIAFQGGYEPAGPNGTITRVGFYPADNSGIVTNGAGREVVLIDDEPAAEVYNRWNQGIIQDKLESGESILAETTMFPLATDIGQVDGVTQYLLIHPEAVSAGRGLKTFRDVSTNTRIYAMQGDREQLIERAGRVSQQAMKNLPHPGSKPAGAIVVYCGGCKLAVGNKIDGVVESIRDNLHGAPFIGCFTFGEQGYILDQNVHGNLMISAVVFEG